MKLLISIAALLIPVLLADSDSDALTARRLYYQDNSPEVVFKSTTVAQQKPAEVKPKPVTGATAAAKPAAATAQQANKTQQIERIQQALRDAASTALNSNGSALKPAANLGVRYNVMRVNAETNQRTDVPPDTVFHTKDCVAVRIQPNRGGYLYVFAAQSSGKWEPLIPSPETSLDSNIVRAYNLMDVPTKYCFEMDENPGSERLFIVVTSKPEDVLKLNESLKNGNNSEIAGNELKPFLSGLQSRDLKITKVGNKPAEGEAAYSTYLVNAAATTSDRLVLEIKLKHEK